MIAPEPGDGIKRQTSRGTLLRNNLLVSALIFAVLEFWRPYFFTTDDNLDAGLPFFTEMGQHLLRGESPFYSNHLFGGDYNFLRDISYFSWHPLYLLVSLLAGTPFHWSVVDVNAFGLFMLTTAGFVNLAWYLRREIPLEISDGWIMFYTLSFTYSIMALTTGASWLTFIGNQSALPWLTLGILQRTWRRGLGLVALFSLHQFLGGHPSPTVASSIFLTLFALAVSVSRRSILPLGCWVGGCVLAVVVILPLIVPMLEGFSQSYRALGVTLDDMQQNNIPVGLFPTALFAGMAIWIINPPEHMFTTYTLALGSCAAAWCLLPTFISRAKWRGLEAASLGMVIFIAIMVCRPRWITEIMMHLPVLRSMRWPFRELLQFLFFLHLFLLLRPPGSTKLLRQTFAFFGTGLLVIPMALYLFPPTFNCMDMDRRLLLSGEFDQYWAKVRPLLKPTDRVAVLIPLAIYTQDRFEEPYSLLATYNYAALAGVINASGYSQTAPRDQLYTKTYAYYPFGAFVPEQKPALMKELPDLKFMTLASLRPLKITLSSRDGPTIDLTPYVPADVKK